MCPLNDSQSAGRHMSNKLRRLSKSRHRTLLHREVGLMLHLTKQDIECKQHLSSKVKIRA
jgi:hypothetical protein